MRFDYISLLWGKKKKKKKRKTHHTQSRREVAEPNTLLWPQFLTISVMADPLTEAVEEKAREVRLTFALCWQD